MRRVIRKFLATKERIFSLLQPQDVTIRVLVLAPGCKGQPLEGKLIDVILQTGPSRNQKRHKYDALSYCWGNDPPNKSILIGETSLEITPNLYDALQHLRSETVTKKIWIDQICINQEDTIERNRQVQQMDAIYAGAREVVAWLGTATIESRVILGSLSQVDDRALHRLVDEESALFQREPHARGPLWISICAEMQASVLMHHPNLENADDWSDTLSLDLCALFQNPWFQRIWIVQESILATRLWFQAGNDRISWHKLFAFLGRTDSVAQLSAQQRAWILNIMHLRATIGGVNDYHPITLGTLVSMFRHQNSRDPRDKVYGLIGLAARMSQNVPEGAYNLQVDYSKSVAQVFTDLVAHDVESCQDIRILSECCSGRVRSLQGLPSWTDDWSQGFSEQNCSPLLFSNEVWRSRYKACGSHKAEAHYIARTCALSINGLDFDVVDDTTSGPHIIHNTKSLKPGQQHEKEEHDYTSSLSQEWRSLALKSTSMNPYGTLEARINALCRTLITDRSDEPVSSDVVKAFVSVWDGEEVGFGDIVSSEGESPLKKCRNLEDWSREFGVRAYSERRLFRTRRGYLGLSCYHVEKGDRVCILWGGELPFILRESGTLDISNSTEQEGKTSTRQVVSHKIVGGYCYIYGLAGGEGVEIAEKEGLAPQKIYIV